MGFIQALGKSLKGMTKGAEIYVKEKQLEAKTYHEAYEHAKLKDLKKMAVKDAYRDTFTKGEMQRKREKAEFGLYKL